MQVYTILYPWVLYVKHLQAFLFIAILPVTTGQSPGKSPPFHTYI